MWPFLLTPWVRYAAAALAAVAVYKAVQYSGVQKERARVEQKASATDAKAQKARDAARKSAGSDPARVLSKYYRD